MARMNVPGDPLAEIEQLLRKYGHIWHANYVAEHAAQLLRQGPVAYRDFATLEWWGGSGSVADMYLGNEQDDRRLRNALISVHDCMKASGVMVDRAAQVTDVFREWEVARIKERSKTRARRIAGGGVMLLLIVSVIIWITIN
jgi:hypothetical protein